MSASATWRSHDELTGLPNRGLLQERMRQALANADRHGDIVGVVYADLDDFKPVNDTLGHTIGDEVLKIVADRLRSCMRESDTVARVGGDEFVALFPRLDSAAALGTVAASISGCIDVPIQIKGHQITVTTSVGLAVYREGEATDELITRADHAMYRAKQDGVSGWEEYLAELAETAGQARLSSEPQRRYTLPCAVHAHLHLRRRTLAGARSGRSRARCPDRPGTPRGSPLRGRRIRRHRSVDRLSAALREGRLHDMGARRRAGRYLSGTALRAPVSTCCARPDCRAQGRVPAGDRPLHARRRAIDWERLEALEDDAVIAELVRLRGVGPWTAEMYLIFALGRPDVLALDDMGLRGSAGTMMGLGRSAHATNSRSEANAGGRGGAWRASGCGEAWAE